MTQKNKDTIWKTNIRVETDQWGKHSPHSPKDLSSEPQHPHKKPGTVVKFASPAVDVGCCVCVNTGLFLMLTC